MLENLIPHHPEEGPPVPRALPPWPWVKSPSRPVAKPVTDDIDAEIEEMTQKEKPPKINNELSSNREDDYVLVLRKKGPNPVWLKEHQKRFTEASKKAAELTKHLTGEEKLRARHEIVSRMLKGG